MIPPERPSDLPRTNVESTRGQVEFSTRAATGLGVALLLALGCGSASSAHRPSRHVRGDEIRLEARLRPDGSFAIEWMDAPELFERARARAREGDCEGAVALYDRLVDRFPSSEAAAPALYNAALCLRATDKLHDAIARLERLLASHPRGRDGRHAGLLLLEWLPEAGRLERAVEVAAAVLDRSDLRSDERLEAMARRALALAELDRLDEAERAAREALVFHRSRRGEDRIADPAFAACAAFVLGEVARRRAESVRLPPGPVPEQRAVLERRARHLLQAQREYFQAMTFADPYWSSASGYRVGELYLSFWETVMAAPVPPPRFEMDERELALYAQDYRRSVARLVEPLLRHAIRYWEMTLVMVERTGARGPWVRRLHEGVERARALLLASRATTDARTADATRPRADGADTRLPFPDPSQAPDPVHEPASALGAPRPGRDERPAGALHHR